MPLLTRSSHALAKFLPARALGPLAETGEAGVSAHGRGEPARRPPWFPVCGNRNCSAGWLRLGRSRCTPVFEGEWCCSPECTRAQVDAALRREMGSRMAAPEVHRHRIPLGLAMLHQRWITAEDLRRSLAAQRQAGAGRLGHWLRRQGVSEQLIARALGLQWSCPVLTVGTQLPEPSTTLLPRLFVDAFGALPMRVAAEKILYLGFEDRLDPGLALAIETMTGLRVESGIVAESEFRRAHARALEASYPAVELVEAASEAALAGVLAKAIERARPVESRLVRVHDCVWLRMTVRSRTGPVPALDAVRDLIGSAAFVR